MKRILALLLLALSLAVPAIADTPPGTKEITDNLGRKYLVDIKTLETPGAGGEPGTIAAAIIEEPNPLPWVGHMFDVAIGFSAVGQAGDDTSSTESALTSFGILWIPKTETGWFAIGPNFSWNLDGRNEIRIDPVPMRITVFADPFSAYRWNLHFSPFSVTIRTGDVDTPRSSAFSFDPTLGFGWEIPRGDYSIEFAAGVGYPFSLEGISDESVNDAVHKAQIGGRATLYWRKR